MAEHHYAHLTIDDGVLSATYECTAPEESPCRLMCHEGCESWSFVDHEHVLVDDGKCLVVAWLNELAIEESNVSSYDLGRFVIDAEWDDGYFYSITGRAHTGQQEDG